MQQSYRQPMDKQAHCETMEVMAGSRNADIATRDKESETNDSAEKEGEFNLAWTTTLIRPPVRDSLNRAKERMVKWRKILSAPPP